MFIYPGIIYPVIWGKVAFHTPQVKPINKNSGERCFPCWTSLLMTTNLWEHSWEIRERSRNKSSIKISVSFFPNITPLSSVFVFVVFFLFFCFLFSRAFAHKIELESGCRLKIITHDSIKNESQLLTKVFKIHSGHFFLSKFFYHGLLSLMG